MSVVTPSTPAPEEAHPSPTTPGLKTLLREIIETILLTVFIYAAVNFATSRFRVESISMEPNLHAGQYVLVEKISYRLGNPHRGDVVVFHHPKSERDLIKRVIGLPGETISVANGVVSVNGTPLSESYVTAGPAYQGTWTLGPDQFFVLGDNRNNSSDSHAWGPLDRKYLIGKTVFVYWPPTNWGLMPQYTYAGTSSH